MFIIDKSHLKKSQRSDTFGMSRVAFYGSLVIVGNYFGESTKTYFRARFYQSPSSGTVRCYANLYFAEIIGTGTGIAKGYGYDKQGTALADALSDMGFTPEHDGGEGYPVIVREIMESLKAVGVENLYIVEVFE